MMKKRILITTSTYFQLIVAVHLKLTQFGQDDVDVIITQHSTGCEGVAERLRQTGIFRSVFYVPDRDGRDEKHVWEKVMRYVRTRVAPRHVLHQMVELNGDYDMFLFNNASLLTHLLWRTLGRHTKCYRFEEGFSTYTRPVLEKSPARRWMIRGAFGDIERAIQGLYLFHPELFRQKVDYPILKMEPMCRDINQLRRVLNDAFEYPSHGVDLSQEYIFMEESFSASGVVMDDVELAQAVADVVGRENLMVKLHPRSTGEAFMASGLSISKASSVPWELVMMNQDLTGKKLLTITSGSVLAGTLYFSQPVEAYLLFRCVNGIPPMLDAAYLKYLEDLSAQTERLHIPEHREEFLHELRKRIQRKN